MSHKASHILVVEDDPLLLSLAVEMLSETEFDIVEAASADEALSILCQRAHQFCLVFTDVNMAGSLDGLELARRVAANWPWVSILITSGREQPRDAMPPQAAFAQKPWRQAALLRQVEETCARAS